VVIDHKLQQEIEVAEVEAAAVAAEVAEGQEEGVSNKPLILQVPMKIKRTYFGTK
jgi:hypothetical protein